MYDTIPFGLNRPVEFPLSLTSFNLVSLDRMERCSVMQLINLGRTRICASVSSKTN